MDLSPQTLRVQSSPLLERRHSVITAEDEEEFQRLTVDRWKANEWEELKAWWSLTWPSMMLCFTGMLQSFTDLAFLGHFNTDEYTAADYLAAASIASMVFEISMAIFTKGVNQVLNVLCSQAYGAGNHKLMGVWLQICILLSGILAIPLILLWWNTATILKRTIGLSENLHDLVDVFARYSTLRIYPGFIGGAVSSFCFAQKIVTPFVLISLFRVVCNILLNQLYIYGIGSWKGLGYKGSPLATATSTLIYCILIVGYSFGYRKDIRTRSWPGLNKITYDKISVFLSQSFPLTIAICLEDFNIQTLSVFAIRLSHTYGDWVVAANNGLLTFFLTLTSFQQGTMNGTSVRCGHFIGAQNEVGARLVIRLALKVSSGVGFIISCCLLFGRHIFPRIYTSDPQILDETAKLMIPVGITYMALTVFFISMAALDAQGRPNVVAASFFIGAWLVCIPTAYVLAFEFDWRLMGLWSGLIAGYATITMFSSYFVWNTDWDAVLKAAKKRNDLHRTDRDLHTELLDDMSQVVENS
mmetsp:Transcript_2758/g.3718  ORF Transcript_2758/g.3718 Transcript_2758/m.3718 type:complete len:527 (-) Transcript_2758:646-2226(-)|eukprot:CAMPEP_0204872992 /NCGR_PEP_ID=MMETSP1348-20121228/39441_1 /ASSEMBLY_ACC=CAM_ASM_000700 /TAXON_ID=215587 /ORGANISM="Aplanochytrium stocchinoi, Strain GSBS06" /LENGTH=526 /DNA_ID=CAMNT_0052028099 /DNA_START=34 /DNA_END=1614 /DNA_ORIENTATION=+